MRRRSRRRNSLFLGKSQRNVGIVNCMCSMHSHYTARQLVHQDHWGVSISDYASVTSARLKFAVPDSVSTSSGLRNKTSRTFGRNSLPQDSKVDMPMVLSNRIANSIFVVLTMYDLGKALRTVKSCVGTTWCRYGIGDSVGSTCGCV